MEPIIDHIEITVQDMTVAAPFYDKLLPLLGFDLKRRNTAVLEDHELHVVEYLHPRLGFAINSPRSAFRSDTVNRRRPGALHHLAFRAASRAEVDRLHRELTKIGAPIVSPPREYPEYVPPGYYALFFKDLEGIKYEIVHTPPQPEQAVGLHGPGCKQVALVGENLGMQSKDRRRDVTRGTLEQAIEKLLLSVDRPGDFCAQGRLLAPMPRLDVKGAGALSFPVPEAQVQALIAVAERAPYGKGPATVVDRDVRDCRQIDAARIRLAGAGWRDTFGRVLAAAADGLGCPADRLDAQLYKLLIYEPGGFFAPHRDTEKADGMIATLSISLPVAGAGGDVVVRHRGRERTIDMTAAEPSELAFAAFYADCEHEVRPVTEGYRLSLVFSLCLRAGDTDTPRTAPDYAQQVDRLARQLDAWGRAPDANEKLAWVLEHEYSEAGLSFDAFKNRDAALARILVAAAGQADCALHAAILHLEEWGAASYSGGFADWDGWDAPDDDDLEMEEVEDYRQWLDGWVGPDGERPPFGEIGLSPEERLPRGALDDAEPDDQRIEEATGNAGATVERTYRRAALVLWPASRTLSVVAAGGIDDAVAWVAEELGRNGGDADERIRTLTAELIEMWPAGRDDSDESDAKGRARMLRLLCETRDEEGAARFLREVIATAYDGSEDEALAAVLDVLGPPGADYFLLDMIDAHLRRRPAAMLGLLWRLDEARGAAADPAWDVVLRETVRAALDVLPAALPPEPEADLPWTASPRPTRFSETAVYRLFALAWRLGLPDAAAVAADAVAAEPRVVAPERTLPAVLAKLHAEEGAAGSAAFARLWRHAAAALLARSAEPPPPPGDWTIAANAGCECEHCDRLRDFCRDPVARKARFPLRKDLRAHLHRTIDGQELDIEHVTERRGRPFTLVCTKTRASHKRRRAEYAEDVSCMQGLIESAPAGGQAADCAPDLAALRAAAAASGTA